MGAILDNLRKAGEATELPVNISSEQIQQQFNQSTTTYPQSNDKPTNRDPDARGQISTEVGGHDTEEVEILDPFSQRVKALVESCGGKYTPPPRTMKVTPQFLAALNRLEQAAPLLNATVQHSLRREHGGVTIARLFRTQHHDHTPASIAGGYDGEVSTDGSASGSQSGSASGSASGDVDKITLARQFIAGDRAAGLELIRRAVRHRGATACGSASGSRSGSASGSQSGSTSGEVSKATVIRALQGFQEEAIALMGGH